MMRHFQIRIWLLEMEGDISHIDYVLHLLWCVSATLRTIDLLPLLWWSTVNCDYLYFMLSDHVSKFILTL